MKDMPAQSSVRARLTEIQESLQKLVTIAQAERDPVRRPELESMRSRLEPMAEQIDRMMDLVVVREMDAARGKSPKAKIRREFICSLGAQFRAWNPGAKLDPTIIGMIQSRLRYLAAFRPAEFTYTDKTIRQYLKDAGQSR